MKSPYTITGNDAGQRMDRFLRKKFPQIPLSALYRILRKKQVKILREKEKLHPKRSEILQKGDQVRLYFDVEKFGEADPKKKPDFTHIVNSGFFRDHFQVRYEDDYFFIADKQAGIAVHPGSKTPWGRSLIDLFTAEVWTKKPNAPEPKLVHRLDKDTSGLILISKNDGTLRKLTALLRKGAVEKRYLALVQGRVKKQSGEIDAALIKTEGSKYTKIRVSQKSEAKSARTLYRVKQYFSTLDATLVEVTLDTGRMHQIRVHFAAEGHPLAGDQSYGDFGWNKILKKKYGLVRQFLHASQLRFIHPETGAQMNCISELSDDLKKILPQK